MFNRNRIQALLKTAKSENPFSKKLSIEIHRNGFRCSGNSLSRKKQEKEHEKIPIEFCGDSDNLFAFLAEKKKKKTKSDFSTQKTKNANFAGI